MEDALISPIGLQILTGAGLIEAGDKSRTIKVHVTETTDRFAFDATGDNVHVLLEKAPYIPLQYRNSSIQVNSDGVYAFNTENNTSDGTIFNKEDFIYVMPMYDGEILSEPYIPTEGTYTAASGTTPASFDAYDKIPPNTYEGKLNGESVYWIKIPNTYNNLEPFKEANAVLVDYYTEYSDGAWQIDIEPQMFGGNFYVEAETLFRDTNGVDSPAEFIIPNCKVQSNFTFSMAASGDPSTFTFTVDAFPDYTRWDKTKKVLASLQVIDTGSKTANFVRYGTEHNNPSTGTRILDENDNGAILWSTTSGKTINGKQSTKDLNVKDGYETFQEKFIEG